MELNNPCDKCHKNETTAVLRQSDETLCKTCWNGGETGSTSKEITIPSLINIEDTLERDNTDNDEGEVDHSFRFSTPSLLRQSTSPLRPLPKTSQARKQVSPPDPSKPDMGLNGKPDGAQPQVKPKQDENPPKIVIKLGHKPVIINNTDATADLSSNYHFEDDHNILKSYIKINSCPKTGRKLCRFNGTAEQFNDFIIEILKLKGSWSLTRDPSNHKIFKAEGATISWWFSTKTLSVSGKQEEAIRNQIRSLVAYPEPSSKPATQEETNKSPEPEIHQVEQDSHTSNQEIKNIWSAIHSLFTSNIQNGSDILSLVKQEREMNYRQNEKLRALLRENNYLKTENTILSSKIKDLESSISQNWDTEGWIKPKKTVSWKDNVPPTWGKVDHNNRYSPLFSDTDSQSNTESDSCDDSEISENQPTFSQQYQTVQLQRKINYLQSKLVEKSEEKKKSVHIPPKSNNHNTGNTKEKNTSSNYTGKSKIKVNPKHPPNNPDSTKKAAAKKDQSHTEGKSKDNCRRLYTQPHRGSQIIQQEEVYSNPCLLWCYH